MQLINWGQKGTFSDNTSMKDQQLLLAIIGIPSFNVSNPLETLFFTS